MHNNNSDKNKASIKKTKLNFEKIKKKVRYPKVITDTESEDFENKNDNISYNEISSEKTDIEEKKENKRKFRNAKSTKKMVNKSKLEVKKSITVIKEPKRKKLYEEENYDNNIYKKKLRKRKNVEKKELDIDMNENSQNNEEIITDFLPCREQEQEQIKNYIKEGLEINGNYNSLYIAGMPGTGKTACVKRVIEILENEFKGKENMFFTTLFLCGTEYPFINKIYKTIYQFIFSNKRKIRKKRYALLINNFFCDRNKANICHLNDPSNSHIILVIDEIDFLINKNQTFLYNLFNWSSYENSKLIIITISNTLDFPNRLLPKIQSRMGKNKIMFKPYNKDQLSTIVESKGIDFNHFSPDAIKLCCMKVSAINGDLRRTIQILLRAKELYNMDIISKSKKKKIEKNYILKACEDLFNSKLKKVMISLQICEKIILCSILFSIKDVNNNKVNVGHLYEKIDMFFGKYNDANKKEEIELYWEEYKKIIYNLIRLQLISFCDSESKNFMENYITIKFYVDEFVNACDGDKDLKPVLNYLTDIISV
jgi:Cdc6-like AAA superfamily ATPase